MIITLTFDNIPNDYIKDGELHRYNQTPNTFFIQKTLDYIPDYTTMEYKGEMFIYVFLFQDFSKDSLLRKIFFSFVQDETLSFYDKNQCAILSNKKLSYYDNKTECIMRGDEIVECDELGGDLTCGIIIDDDEIVIDNYKQLLTKENASTLIPIMLESASEADDPENEDFDGLIRDYPNTLDIACNIKFRKNLKIFFMNEYGLFLSDFGNLLREDMNDKSHSFDRSLSKYHDLLLGIAYNFLKSDPKLKNFIDKYKNVTFNDYGEESDMMWEDLLDYAYSDF